MTRSIREQIRSMLQVEPRDGGYRATLTVDKDFSILPDHFRNSPILPGVCMVQAVLLGAATALGQSDLRMRVLKNAKLMQPVKPGETIFMDANITRMTDGDITIKATLTCNDRRCAEISLLARLLESTQGTPP